MSVDMNNLIFPRIKAYSTLNYLNNSLFVA